MDEKIYDVYWEGPYHWNKRETLTNHRHVLYSIYGTHPVYGREALVYIGMTENTVYDRLSEHEHWIEYELDDPIIKVASIGIFEGWAKWESMKEPYPHPGDINLIKGVEALLIHAHQPSYNTAGKSDVSDHAKGIRIFNTGKSGILLPEISYLFYQGYD